MKKWYKRRGWTAGVALACMVTLTCGGLSIRADGMYMPDVTEEMEDPGFWLQNPEEDARILAEPAQIEEINQAILQTPDCYMNDLRRTSSYYKGQEYYQMIWSNAFADASAMLAENHYDEEGELVSWTNLLPMLNNIGGEYAEELERIRFGICVNRADVMALPSNYLATDEKGDLNYNYCQVSSLRVNEPVAIKAISNDGEYYFCVSDSVVGWVAAEDIAICKDRDEWMAAWDIPSEEAIVVTDGKIYLEDSNVNPVASRAMLTMGTVLRKVSEEEYDAAVNARMPFHNCAVWMPVRTEDGSYDRTIALIPTRYGISEGYLPLTTENILETAFTKLGDTYGWGGMLSSQDCSGYIRDIYQCFGLKLARNTSWQAAMPVYKYDVAEADLEEKKEILDTLPAGAILHLTGHEMMYLGHEGDKYYVISAMGSALDGATGEKIKVRGVVINTLDTLRMNGKTWLEEIHTMQIPYQLPGTEEAESEELAYAEDGEVVEVEETEVAETEIEETEVEETEVAEPYAEVDEEEVNGEEDYAEEETAEVEETAVAETEAEAEEEAYAEDEETAMEETEAVPEEPVYGPETAPETQAEETAEDTGAVEPEFNRIV